MSLPAKESGKHATVWHTNFLSAWGYDLMIPFSGFRSDQRGSDRWHLTLTRGYNLIWQTKAGLDISDKQHYLNLANNCFRKLPDL